VQRAMAAWNATVPPERRIEFRMGIDLGDIIKDGRDIYGDGVNVASLKVVVLGCSIQLI
jgi:adenylate cyclase